MVEVGKVFGEKGSVRSVDLLQQRHSYPLSFSWSRKYIPIRPDKAGNGCEKAFLNAMAESEVDEDAVVCCFKNSRICETTRVSRRVVVSSLCFSFLIMNRRRPTDYPLRTIYQSFRMHGYFRCFPFFCDLCTKCGDPFRGQERSPFDRSRLYCRYEDLYSTSRS